MDRRAFLGTLGLLPAPFAAGGQQAATVPRIGVLVLFGTAPTPGQPNPLLDAFRGGLRDLGYVEGQNLIIEYGGVRGSPSALSIWPPSSSATRSR